VHALLVGIDRYPAPIPALRGCANDIDAIEAVLRGRLDDRLLVRRLIDEAATRDGVVAGFREHLMSAGGDDVALFVFAGHGSEEPVGPEYARLEPTTRIQTLVLHDTGRPLGERVQRPLADKELAMMLGSVARRAGHVSVVLDCCHSGSGTRDPFVRPRGWTPPRSTERDLGRLAFARDPEEFLPGTLDGSSSLAATHVALAACGSWETAKEFGSGSAARGAFSVALEQSLLALGENATYRALHATVASRVAQSAHDHHPELHPTTGLSDQHFLGASSHPCGPGSRSPVRPIRDSTSSR